MLELLWNHPDSPHHLSSASLTCVLSKLVHGLQVDDVWRERGIHLAQHYSSPDVPLQYILNMVANRCAVGPPSPMFILPLPDHHPGQVLRGVPQPVAGRQQPRSWTSHLLLGVRASAAGYVQGDNSTATLPVNWHTGTFSSAPDRKKLESATSIWLSSIISCCVHASSSAGVIVHRCSVTAGSLISQRQPLSSCVLSCFKRQTLRMRMMMIVAAVDVSVLHHRSQRISSR